MKHFFLFARAGIFIFFLFFVSFEAFKDIDHVGRITDPLMVSTWIAEFLDNIVGADQQVISAAKSDSGGSTPSPHPTKKSAGAAVAAAAIGTAVTLKTQAIHEIGRILVFIGSGIIAIATAKSAAIATAKSAAIATAKSAAIATAKSAATAVAS